MKKDYPDLTGKYALITGSSRGIGYEVAKACAKAGAHVILLARTIGGLEALDDEIRAMGGSATLMPFNLLKLEEIDKLGPALAEKFGRLDILIGNAGMLGTLGPLTHTKGKDWDQVMSVNLHANFRLIRTLDPLLKASESGRAVFTSSGLARLPMAYWGAYCTSKAALEMMVKTYAAEVEKTSLKVNLIDPGTVDTKMLQQAFPGGYQGQARTPEEVVPAFMHAISPACQSHGEVIRAADFD